MNVEESSFRDYMNSILSNKESEELEFKHAKGGFPGSFWESYSSFANSEGGTIVLGVKEKNGMFYPEGLSAEQISKYKEDFWNQLRSPQKVSQRLLTDKDVHEEEYNGSYFLVFDIPRATRDQRPVFIGPDPARGTYRRNNSGDYLCTSREISQMYAEQETELALDKEIFEFYTIEDLDSSSLREYRQMFFNRLPTHPWSSLDDKKFLIQLGAYRKDRARGIEGVTLAGILMFGTNETLTELLPQYMIDYREIEGNTPDTRWSNRIYNDGTWEANLFQSYRKILPRLQSFLPASFRLKGNERVDDSPAHVALREAFVNFCIHAQYQSDTPLVIVKYPTEITFSNPGTMLVSMDQYYSGGTSICRNPSLQKMFLMIGAAEKAGSGVDKILEGWRDAQFRTPYILETSRPNKVELILPLESTLSSDVLEKINNLYGEKVIASLGRNESIAVALAFAMGSISNGIVRHSIDLHTSDITKLLHELCAKSILKSYGFGRGTRYAINFEYEKVEELSHEKVEELSHEKADEKADERPNERLNNKPDDGIRGKRRIISELSIYCQTWKKSSEMARHVGKSLGYITSHIIPTMISDKIIEREYPENPHDPRQRYRTKLKQ